MLRGTVANAGSRRVLTLEKNGTECARASLDINSRFVMPDLLPGHYLLRAENSTFTQPVELSPDQDEMLLNLDFSEVDSMASKSVISGNVAGGAGAVVVLLRGEDGEEWVTMVRDTGRFRFVDLPLGTYNIRVQGQGSRIDGLTLDGVITREVN
ncbi:MAG: carboxypeptidase regulatory-like domain-containing protein [Caldilineaceae bacterium]|nr:carboxypeptidase regulatory-like domain-containing protein [Caldilineaceae bacterium]